MYLGDTIELRYALVVWFREEKIIASSHIGGSVA